MFLFVAGDDVILGELKVVEEETSFKLENVHKDNINLSHDIFLNLGAKIANDHSSKPNKEISIFGHSLFLGSID